MRELSHKLVGAEQECAYLRHQYESMSAQKEDGEKFVMQAGGLVEMLKESHEYFFDDFFNINKIYLSVSSCL